MNSTFLRRLAKLEEARSPIHGFAVKQLVDGDDARPSDREIEAQIAQAVERGIIRRAEDALIIRRVIVEPPRRAA